MNRVVHWFAFGIVGAVLALPAHAGWTAGPLVDGQGRTYFIAGNSVNRNHVELFCAQDGTVNLSLTWPDWQHRNAADNDEPAKMSVETDAGARFEAKSYYWASGKGLLILDFGDPGVVRDIAEALKIPDAGLTVTVEDAVNGIEKTVYFDAEGAAAAAIDFLAWCPVVK
jgi:hypothetical protein